MDSKLVDFSVIKQKIIKTDEVLQMYMENNKKLKKTQQAYKDLKSKYEEASSGLNRFQLESDRCTFNLQHITSKHNKLESEYKHLEQQNKSLEQKYCKHMIDSQTAMLDLENELKMMKELNEGAELMSSPKKKLPSRDKEPPQKIKELEEAVKKLKQSEARFKEENDKLLLERKELVGDMKKMRNEHSKIVFVSQEERSKLVIELNGLKSQIVSKHTHYNDVILAKDKEISKLNAEVLALRGLKEQLKYLKEENKKLNNDITHKKKLKPSCAVQTQTTQDIRSVLDENMVLKNKIKMYKGRTSKCEFTQTESDEECQSLKEIFKEMTMLPRMLSPLPDDLSNCEPPPSEASDKETHSLENQSSIHKSGIKEHPQLPLSEDNKNVPPFEALLGDSQEFNDLDIKENPHLEDESTLSKAINIKENLPLFKDSLVFKNQPPINVLEVKEIPHLEAESTLHKADDQQIHGFPLPSMDIKENLPPFEAPLGDSQEFKNQSPMNVLKIKKNPHIEAEPTLSKANDQQNYAFDLPSMDIKENIPLFKASLGDSQVFKNQSPINVLEVKINPHLEAESTLHKADGRQNYGIGLPSMDIKENLPPFEAPLGDSQEFKNQSPMNVLKIKENPHIEAEPTLSKANDQQNYAFDLPSMDFKENIPLFKASLGDSQVFKNQSSINVLEVKINPHLEAESTLHKADDRQNYGIGLPSMDIKENLPPFEAPFGDSQEFKNQSPMNVLKIKENPHIEAESTLHKADDRQNYGIGLPSMDIKENLPPFEAPLGDSQEFKNQSPMNVLKIKENPHIEAESTLHKADDRQNYGFPLPSMDIKENLAFLDASMGESQKIENLPSIDDADIKENPQFDNRLYQRFSLLSVDNEESLHLFEDPAGDSQGFTSQPPINVASAKENSQLEVESTLCTAIDLPPMDNKENLLFKVQEGDSQELEHKPTTNADIILGDSEPVASCSSDKKSKSPQRQRRKYRLASKVSDSTRTFRGHPLNSRQIFRKEMRMRKCRRVDSVLRALQVLKRSKINFTISNESTLPPQWKDPNWLDRVSGAPMDFGQPSRRTRVKNPMRTSRTNVNQSIRKLSCPSTACKSVCMSLESGCGTANLLGFFNVKQEAVSPLGEPPDKKPDNPLQWLNDSLHSENLLEKLADLVSEKLKKDKHAKRKRPASPRSRDSEFCSETETELERLIEDPAYDVLERNKMLLKRAKYDLGRESTSVTSLETSDTKNSVDTPPFADNGAKTEQLEAATTYEKCADLQSPLRHSLPPTVAKTAVRALWNTPAPKQEPTIVAAGIPKEMFENADSCDSYKFPACPNLLSPLSSCAADSPKIRHFYLTPKKEDSKIDTELASDCKLEQKSPIKRISELIMSRLPHPSEIKLENFATSVKTEAAETSDSEQLTKLGCSGIVGLYTDRSPEKPNLAPSLTTPLTANNSPGLEPHTPPSSNLSHLSEPTSPSASTHRSFHLLNCSNLRQYTNKSKNRRSLTNSMENCTLSRFPVVADPKQTLPLSQFACKELLKPKSELEVGPQGGDTAIKDVSLSPSSINGTDALSVGLGGVQIQEMDPSTRTLGLFVDPQESMDVSAELHDFSANSCISDFLANESRITKEIESFMTRFGMDRSFTQATILRDEKTDGVSRKMSASDILDILPGSEEVRSSYERHEEVPSCPQSPELQPAPADFVAKVIPLERNRITGTLDILPKSEGSSYGKPEEVPSCPQSPELHPAPVDVFPKAIPLDRNLGTDTANTSPFLFTAAPDILPKLEVLYSCEKEKEEVPSCPQSPELHPAPVDFFPKAITLDRNLGTYTPITSSTLITDTLDILPKQDEEDEVPGCPQSPEFHPAPADFITKVIPLERNIFTDTLTTDAAIPDTPFSDMTIAHTPITDTGVTGSPITGNPRKFTLVTSTPITNPPITGTPILFSTIPDTPSNGPTIPDTPIFGPTIPAPIIASTIPDTSIIASTIPDTPISGPTIPDTPIIGPTIPAPIIASTIPDTSIIASTIPDTPISDPTIPATPIIDSTIPATPIIDSTIPASPIVGPTIPDNPKNLRKGVVTKEKNKVTQRRSKRLSKAIISSSSENESEDDVCDRLRENATKTLNVDNTETEQIKRKRGRPRICPPKEMPPEAEKVVRKRGRPRKHPVQEVSSEELESKRNCVETKDIVESDKEKNDVADGGASRILTGGGSQPSESFPLVAPKKAVKPKQKISKLKSSVMRQMKLKQKMFQSDKPGSNSCGATRNDVAEASVEIGNDRLGADGYDKVGNDFGDKRLHLDEPGNNFREVNRSNAVDANLEIRDNRWIPEFSNNRRFEKLARDPDKRITVVQDIIIRAGHTTIGGSHSNLGASSSQNVGDSSSQNVGDIPKKCARSKKSFDLLSRIMGDMDKDRPKVARKKSVAPEKILPQGLDDKQWRKGILDIAEITHNKDVEVKESCVLPGHDVKMDSGILNRGIEMPDKIQFLLKKLMKSSNEDEIPDHVITEFKKLQVDIIVDVIIHEVAQDFIDKPDTKHFPAPLMTKTQRIYLALMLKLEQKKVEQLIDKFLARAKHYILRRGCGLRAAIPLTRLIIGVCRIRADIHTMRTFCCDAFFFIGDLAVPILFTVLTSWIDVIPMEADVANYPMAKVLVQLVHLKTFTKHGYNLFALRCLLSQFYGYPKERWNCDTFFEEVFHEYLRNPSPSSDFALRLFCRNKDTKWVYKKINEFFIPLIYKIPTENENFKATTILLLGKICRQFRLKEEHDRACLVELNRFFAGMLEDDVTELVKRSVSLALDRLPKKRVKINKEEKQGDPKALANENSRIVRQNMTKRFPNPNWGWQNNKTRQRGLPKGKWASKKKAPRKGTPTATGQ